MRILFLLMLVMTSISMSGQEKKWYISEVPADELIGTEAKIVYQYVESGIGDVVYSEKDRMFMLTTEKGIFDYYTTRTSLGRSMKVQVLMGFYDKNNKLIKKKDLDYIVTDDGKSCYTRWLGEMIPFLKSSNATDGYVRFRASLYGNAVFDITVPLFSECKRLE